MHILMIQPQRKQSPEQREHNIRTAPELNDVKIHAQRERNMRNNCHNQQPGHIFI